jgi:cytochrome b561
MSLRNTTSAYGSIAKLLHWSIVLLIIAQLALAKTAADLPTGLRKLEILAWHKSFGMTILMLALLRLAWRYTNPRPAPLPGTPRWQRIAAAVSHGLLYGLILLQPLTGWLMSSAKNYPVGFFGLFQWPDLVPPDKALFEYLKAVHAVLARTLVTVALIHIAAALHHHFWRKDDVLRRMLPFGRPRSPEIRST